MSEIDRIIKRYKNKISDSDNNIQVNQMDMNKLIIELEYLRNRYAIAMMHVARSCDNCAKHNTSQCPNSFLCYSRSSKPFWKPTWAKDLGNEVNI